MNPSTQIQRAEHFRTLHDRRRILLLPNAWDAGSAAVFANLGFAAIATTSGGMAWSLGHADGEELPLEDHLAAIRRMVRVIDVPLTVDFEAGYGATPQAVSENVHAAIDAGVAGINLEDGVRHERVRPIDDAASRVAAAREAARRAGVPIVINARVDLWMVPATGSEAERIDEAVRRAHAYLAAGADCVYPIGVSDAATIEALAAAIDAPINIGARPGLPPLAELARLGVARVSTATRLATLAFSAARDAARAVQADGGWNGLDAPFNYPDMQRLFADHH